MHSLVKQVSEGAYRHKNLAVIGLGLFLFRQGTPRPIALATRVGESTKEETPKQARRQPSGNQGQPQNEPTTCEVTDSALWPGQWYYADMVEAGYRIVYLTYIVDGRRVGLTSKDVEPLGWRIETVGACTAWLVVGGQRHLIGCEPEQAEADHVYRDEIQGSATHGQLEPVKGM